MLKVRCFYYIKSDYNKKEILKSDKLKMATASWFNWAPTGPYNSPFFPPSVQQSPVLPQNQEFFQDYRVKHPRADPFRGYTDEGINSKFSRYSDITPERFLHEEPADSFGQSPVLPGSQSVVGEKDELKYAGKSKPFQGSTGSYFPPNYSQKARFTAWLPSDQRPKTNKNSNGMYMFTLFIYTSYNFYICNIGKPNTSFNHSAN